MKTKICIGILTPFLALIIALHVNAKRDLNSISSLAFANIEALARTEGTTGQTLLCYNTIYHDGPASVQTHKTYCGDCVPLLCTKWSEERTCVKK